MPNRKVGTVTSNVGDAVRVMLSGRIEFRAEKNAIVHAASGKLHSAPSALEENVLSFLVAVMNLRPRGVKGAPSESNFVKDIVLSSTMGKHSYRVRKYAIVRYHRPADYNLILGSAVPLICDNRPKYHQVLIFDASSKERFRRCKLYECYTKVNDSCVRSIDITMDGERARQLANTLLGAKDGGHHHPKRTSALTSLRSSDTIFAP